MTENSNTFYNGCFVCARSLWGKEVMLIHFAGGEKTKEAEPLPL